MAAQKLIAVGLGTAVTLIIIFGFTMWKSPIKNFTILRKKYFRKKSEGAFKHEKFINEDINEITNDKDYLDEDTDTFEDYINDNATDTFEETDDEFHDAQEFPFENGDKEKIFAMVDSLSMKDKYSQLLALNILRKYENEVCCDEPELLWRIAQSLRNKSVIEYAAKNIKKQNEFLNEARTYAKQALDLDEGNPHAHKWYGLVCGEIGQHQSLREQVRMAKIFKDHVNYAYTKLPEDYLINFALGVFEYEASSRSYLERSAAKLVFGKLFDCSIASAIEYFMTSEKILPCKRNRFFLTRCYLYDNVLPLAHTWFHKAVNLPAITPDDYLADEEMLEASREKKFQALENVYFNL